VRSTLGARAACVAVLASFIATGCSGGQSDLQKWIAETKKKPGGRIQALPEVKPYETFVYSANTMRSPFQPQGPGAIGGGVAGLRPTARRNREFLEGFSLDTLRMVGTFKVAAISTGWCSRRTASCTRCSPAIIWDRTMGKSPTYPPARSVSWKSYRMVSAAISSDRPHWH